MLLALNKPYGVVSRFTAEREGQRTLAEYGLPPHVYPIGRLDADSEGLLLLTDEANLVGRLLDPRHAHPRRYHAQVEGIPTEAALGMLARGVMLQDGPTRPARAWILDPRPSWPPRVPPIRVRATIPDTWIALEITEGRNRQVRRMTAAIGYPTLRLIRVSIGRYVMSGMPPGMWIPLDSEERQKVLSRGRPI